MSNAGPQQWSTSVRFIRAPATRRLVLSCLWGDALVWVCDVPSPCTPRCSPNRAPKDVLGAAPRNATPGALAGPAGAASSEQPDDKLLELRRVVHARRRQAHSPPAHLALEADRGAARAAAAVPPLWWLERLKHAGRAGGRLRLGPRRPVGSGEHAAGRPGGSTPSGRKQARRQRRPAGRRCGEREHAAERRCAAGRQHAADRSSKAEQRSRRPPHIT